MASVLQTIATPCDRYRAAAHGIHLDEHGIHLDITRGDLEAGRHPVEEPLDDCALLHADYGVVRPGHAYVGDVGRTPGQDLLVRGSHMRVRSDHRRDTPIKIPAHGLLFTRGFGVHVHNDDLRFGLQLAYFAIRDAERIIV